MAKILLEIIGKDKFGKVSAAVESKAKRLKKAVSAVGVAGTAGILGLGYAAKNTISAFEKQEQAVARLESSMKNVKTASSSAADELKAYAAEMQKVTKFGDEQIISAQAMLGTFQLNEDQIKAITPRLLDMATATEKASGTTADLEAIAIALGKGLTGQPGILSRYGVVLDKVAVKAKGFDGILESLDNNFKGMAESVANTPTGKLKQMSNLFGDMKEEIGGLVLQAISPLVESLKSLFEWFNDLPAAGKKFILAITGAMAILKLFAGAISVLLPAMGPAGWLLAGLGLAATLFFAFSQKAKTAEEKLADFHSEIKNSNLNELNTKLEETNKQLEKATETTLGGVSAWEFIKVAVKGAAKSFSFATAGAGMISELFTKQAENVEVLEGKITALKATIAGLEKGKSTFAKLSESMNNFKTVEKIDLIRPMELQMQGVIDIQKLAFDELSGMRQMSMQEELNLLEISWLNIDAHQRKVLGGEEFLQQQMFDIRKRHNDAWANFQQSAFNTIQSSFTNLVANKMQKIMNSFIGEQKGLWGAFISEVVSGLTRIIAKMLVLKALKFAAGGPLGFLFETGGRVPALAETGMRTTGRDTVPAMMQPGEVILPRRVTQANPAAVDNMLNGRMLNSGGASRNTNVKFYINAIDAQGVKQFIESDDFKERFIDALNYNDLKLTTKSGEQLEGAY